MSHQTNIKKVGGDNPLTNTLFLITVETDFDIVNQKVVSNKDDLSKKKTLEVETRKVNNEELNNLAMECKNFNQRQEFYIMEDTKNNKTIDTLIKYKYISSKNPLEDKSDEVGT